MARVPDDLLERLKREVKLAELVVASGVKLAKKGPIAYAFQGHGDTHPRVGAAQLGLGGLQRWRSTCGTASGPARRAAAWWTG